MATSSDSPEPADQPAASPPAEAQAPLEPKPGIMNRLRRWIWPILCLMQLGLLIGGYVAYRDARSGGDALTDHGQAQEPPKHSKPVETAPPSPPVVVDPLEHGDKLIRAGRYDQALALFQGIEPKALGPQRDLAQYRAALCLEGLGRWDEAFAAYQGLIAQNPNTRVVIAAQVGQARVWVRSSHLEEAKVLTCQLLLRSAPLTKINSAALKDAQFLLALTLTQEAGRPDRHSSFLGDVVGAATFHWSVEPALDWADTPEEDEAPPPEPLKETLTVQKNKANPEDSLVQKATFPTTPVRELLDRLAATSGLKTEWTVEAIHLVENRRVATQVENVIFQDLGRLLTGPFGLTWKIRDNVMHWSAMEETSAEELKSFRFQQARRALREAVVAHPDHELAAAAYLNLGNLEVWAGQLPQATAWYEQLVQQIGRSPLLVEGNYNLGLIQHRLGNDSAARKAFYGAIDLAPSHELTPRAYLALGRIWLEAGLPIQAISPLRRALTTSPGSPAQPAIVLSLAASYIWSGDPRSANAVLVANRAVMSQPAVAPMAAFLDAFCRFRAAGDRRQTRHAGDLLTALLNLREEPDLQAVGKLLAGKAYLELGMKDQMIALYQNTLHDTRGPIAEEMTFTLAEALFAAEKREEAKKLLLSLAVVDQSRWASPAKFRLAEIALREKRPKETLLWGRQLLPVLSSEKMPDLLNLMGKAFEQEGQYEQAARCFNGERPT